MATNDNERFTEKVKDFFTQNPSDRTYEEQGGDDRVPAPYRTDDPKADANEFAKKAGEPLPYPDHVRAAADPEPSESAEASE